MSDPAPSPKTPVPPTSSSTALGEEKKRRTQRNLAIGLMIGAFVVLVYAVTILRLGASVADRPF